MCIEYHRALAARWLLSLMASPGAAGQQNQNGENFQSACQHSNGKKQFGYIAIAAEIHHRADGFHTGADVVKAGQYGRNVCADGESVQGDDQVANDNNDDISCQIGVGVVQYLFVYSPSVIADDHYFPGIQDLTDIPAQNFENQQ